MKRIRKDQARKLYNMGFTITLCPCKFRIDSAWGISSPVEKPKKNTDFYTKQEIDFDSIVNRFEFYNCIDTETGKHAGFYVTERKKS